jgi:hypothetical protein
MGCWSILMGGGQEGDTIGLSRGIWFALFCVVSPLGLLIIYKETPIIFFWHCAAAIGIQSIFVIDHFFDPEFRMWSASVLASSGNIAQDSSVRSSGLTNGLGSAGSLIQASGCIAALFAFAKSERYGSACLALFLSLLCSVGAGMMGRTGLILCLLSYFFLAFYAILKTTPWKKPQIFAIPLVLGSLFALVVAIDSTLSETDSARIESLSDWAFEWVQPSGTESISTLKEQEVRPLSFLESITGTGRTSSHTDFNFSGHDSGYIQNMVCFGLPLTLLFYLTLSFIIFTLFRNRTGPFISFLVMLSVLLLDLKEPFIFKYAVPLFVVTTGLLFQHGNWITIPHDTMHSNRRSSGAFT